MIVMMIPLHIAIACDIYALLNPVWNRINLAYLFIYVFLDQFMEKLEWGS